MPTEQQRIAGKPWWQMPLANPVRGESLRPPTKGEYNGECHRIACDHGDAHWFNETNGRYYCASCARHFNEVARRHGQASHWSGGRRPSASSAKRSSSAPWS